MRKTVIFLVTLAAMGLLFTQASAWQDGSQMGYGGPAYTANQQAPATTNGNVAQLRAEISSMQAQLSNELAKDNVNMDKIRKLNQKLAQKRQALQSMSAQSGGAYRQGTGNSGYMGNMRGMRGRGYMRGMRGMGGRRPCW